jgi:DNA-binding Xre family transcriptional regulator
LAFQEPVLAYVDYSGRLSRIALFVKFVMGAIAEFEVSLPERESFKKGQLDLIEGFQMMLEALENAPVMDPKEFAKAVRSAFVISERSRQLVCNLSLVMLCTEMEIFIEHLIDVILTKEPRRLKDLASAKQLSVAELMDCEDYDAVLRSLRRKVSKEVTDSSTRDMFLKHLGQRFGLFSEQELSYLRYGDQENIKLKWGIAEIEQAYATRNKIVHEGQLVANEDFFYTVLAGFLWLTAFLSWKAQKKYNLTVDSREILASWIQTYALKETSPISSRPDA